ncbi:hypothetical protein [Terribacillus saccharophilus]|uniref:hypothetical protein n=1 Tax=Terribacillus saccharophilus TaxID=361277 RepID=UPI002DD221B9|nr:hypothetical protein [Terribacillus saccharophilus]MEC0288938.1 hypothetical protein [Terribacillus saccharophilus]
MSPDDLKRLSDDGLRELAKDAYCRIGTHSVSEYPSEYYMEQQKGIIAMISEELTRRTV